MLKMTWYKHKIEEEVDIVEFIKTFKQLKPKYGAFDTETNGLHIIRCTPFLLAFGFVNPNIKEGHTYTLDLIRNADVVADTMHAIKILFRRTEKVVAWNAKFDMHMMHNVGYPHIFKENITDAMIYVRLSHDAISKKDGGVPLGLKDYAKEYITPDAKTHEKKIKEAQTHMSKIRTKKLKQMLAGVPLPEDMSRYKGNYKSWTMGLIEEILSDKIVGIDALEPEVKDIIAEWEATTPDPDDYSNIDIDIIEPYAHFDVIYTLEAFIQTKEVAEIRKQHSTIKLEEDLIVPLYEMERVGFAFNKDYATESKQRVKDYILGKQDKLHELAGEFVTASQHAKLKDIFLKRFGIRLPSTGQGELSHLVIKGDSKAQEFVDTITQLRTLEKWYSTYILRLLDNNYQGRIYTTINQVGTASGRVSSDFQQFPNKALYDDQGNEMFHPRKMVVVSKDKYNKILFIDYSQIELRIQAMYTLMTDSGDRNLCRAYMPYHCFREVDEGIEAYDVTKHLKDWDSGEWKLTESPDEFWKPIDLHSLTTLTAFPHLKETDEDFQTQRKKGKTANFACNYGASAATMHRDMKLDIDTAEKLYSAYLKSFPGVIKYRHQVQRLIDHQGYVMNIYGRRYYGITGHLGSNYLVQGSAADFLKAKMIEVSEFLKDFKTRLIMNIHDELLFELHEDDPADLPDQIKKIMQVLPNTIVPIVADIEITDTSWAEKVKYE